MLTVLIADDEPIVREGLKSLIDWGACGYTICGDAEDGPETVQKIEALSPDVAIVDINMPERDGLWVSEYVKAHHLVTKIIFLTGYHEFLYARRAIGLGVKAYLLKPVDEDDLIETLTTLRDEIREEKRSSVLVEAGAETTFNDLMEKILTGADVWHAKELVRELYEVELDWPSYQVALVHGQFEREARHEIRRRLIHFLQTRNFGICFSLNRQITLLLKSDCLTHDHPDVLALYNTISDMRPQLILGSPCNSPANLQVAYQQCVNMANKGFLLSDQRIVDASVALCHRSKDVDNTAALLVKHIESFDEESVLSDIERVKHFLVEYTISKEQVYSFYTSLLVAVCNLLKSDGEESLLHEIYSVNRDILEMDRIEAVEAYVKERILKLMWGRFDKLSMGNLLPILEYIQNNLDTDLKLKTLAEHFNYNSAYLGKMFKERTGTSFNEYVDQIKMEKAQGYIQEGYMVYEAAKMVGYTNINYFNSKFKKYTGISPGAMRKQAKEAKCKIAKQPNVPMG